MQDSNTTFFQIWGVISAYFSLKISSIVAGALLKTQEPSNLASILV